jgi:flagellar biosynthetic protein FliR
MPFTYAGLEQQMLLWMLALVRPGAAFLAAPVFGAPQVPVQLRLVIALAVGLPGFAHAGIAMPAEGIVSVAGLLMIAGEVVAGLAIGFALQIGFAAAMVAGEAISNAMGLGFAAMTNPMTGHASPAVGQFLSMLATFIFLAADGHLAFAQIIFDSYGAIVPGRSWLSVEAMSGIVEFGGLMFKAGVSIALPVAFALILVQIMMGMVARSAPALNLIAVGFPAVVLAGVILLAMAVPALADALAVVLTDSLDAARQVAGSASRG